ANSAAAKNAARRPYSRPAAAHSSAVAPSMNTSDSTRAPANPPTLSASAPRGGEITRAPGKEGGDGGGGGAGRPGGPPHCPGPTHRAPAPNTPAAPRRPPHP